jgi:hypothetical protein
VASGLVVEAFGAEAERLSEMVSRADEAALDWASPCPPWTIRELLCHVRIGVGRVPGMLGEPEPSPGPVIPAADYYRPDQRFSPVVNRDRIAAAQQAAAALAAGSAGSAAGSAARSAGSAAGSAGSVGSAAGSAGSEAGSAGSAAAREFDRAWRDAWAQIRRAPQERLVHTRHGDRMLLTDFLRTRVLELAVHGLDLASGLGCRPWMTDAAAAVVEELMLPATAAARLLDESGWDHATLIAKATGRLRLTPAETALTERHGLRRLALG